MPPMPKKKLLKIVNRGPAGLLNSHPGAAGGNGTVDHPVRQKIVGKKNNIARPLAGLVVSIKELNFDPENARKHPERNMDAIELSLATYGQLRPIVVRKHGRIVIAGNGTLQGAKNLGWTLIAAVIVNMDEAQAIGYGIADNRTAELATWDLDVLKRHSLLLQIVGVEMVGWSDMEVTAIRLEEWVDVAVPPQEFPSVDEGIEVEHLCPKCGYAFSGGETKKAELGVSPSSADEDLD